MGERKYITLQELVQTENIPAWRIRQMIRTKELHVRHLNGKPVKPYLIDLEHFRKIDSSAGISAENNNQQSSLKIEDEIKKAYGPRKEPLWQK